MKDPILILMTGVSGSGKTLLSHVIENHLGPSASVINVGDVLAKYLSAKVGIKIEDRNLIGEYFFMYKDISSIHDLVDSAIIDRFIDNEFFYIIVDGFRYRYSLYNIKRIYRRNIHFHVHAKEEDLVGRISMRKNSASYKFKIRFDEDMDFVSSMADFHVFSSAFSGLLGREKVERQLEQGIGWYTGDGKRGVSDAGSSNRTNRK